MFKTVGSSLVWKVGSEAHLERNLREGEARLPIEEQLRLKHRLVAVDFLIEEKGLPAVIEYFQLSRNRTIMNVIYSGFRRVTRRIRWQV